jgi:hypothetical protein
VADTCARCGRPAENCAGYVAPTDDTAPTDDQACATCGHHKNAHLLPVGWACIGNRNLCTCPTYVAPTDDTESLDFVASRQPKATRRFQLTPTDDTAPTIDRDDLADLAAFLRGATVEVGEVVMTIRMSRWADALDAETREVERLRELAERNWQSWEHEATEHARTLSQHAVYGKPETGKPLSEGENRRFEAAVERGLRKRAEDQRDAEKARVDAAEAEVERLTRMLSALGFCVTDGESLPCMTCGAGL